MGRGADHCIGAPFARIVLLAMLYALTARVRRDRSARSAEHGNSIIERLVSLIVRTTPCRCVPPRIKMEVL
jgi:cytochrome P450